MAPEPRILTFAEFAVIYAWSFVVFETLCLLLLFYFLAYSGWLWFLVVETALMGALVCVEVFVSGKVRQKLGSNKAYQALQIISFMAEGTALYGLGILYKDYETATYSWYFILLLVVKLLPLGLMATVTRIK
jgi:hypothetical protein